MITLRSAQERGMSRIDWLDSRHTFSFGDYYDPAHAGFRALRVINDDRVAPGAGFPTHGHADMEIVSYVLSGALEHRDSIGTGSVIRPGDVQRMSAGSGVRHSEFNASKNDPVHFLQIWVIPERRGLQPSYEQKPFSVEEKQGRFRLIGSRDGRDGSVTIHQDVNLYAGLFGGGETGEVTVAPGRHVWVQVAAGTAEVGSEALRMNEGDGAAITGEQTITVRGVAGQPPAELLVFDLG